MKDRVIYPEYFSRIEDAEAFVAEFAEWYNYAHLHSALDLLTPFSVHHCLQQEILERRNGLLEEARARQPECHGTRKKVFRIEPGVRLKHQITLKKKRYDLLGLGDRTQADILPENSHLRCSCDGDLLAFHATKSPLSE